MSHHILRSGRPRPRTHRNHDLTRFVFEHAEEIAEAIPGYLASRIVQMPSDSGRMRLLLGYFRASELAMQMTATHAQESGEGEGVAIQSGYDFHQNHDLESVLGSPKRAEQASLLTVHSVPGKRFLLGKRFRGAVSGTVQITSIVSEILRYRSLHRAISVSFIPAMSQVLGDRVSAESEEPVEIYGHGRPPEPLPDTGAHEPVARPNDRLLSTAEFAARHEPMSPQTVRNHILAKRIIGWRNGPKRWVIPEDQLSVEGYFECMPALLGHFPSSAIAWHWLNRPNRNTRGETPLARLRDGAEAEVLAAARMYEAGDFT